MQFWDGSWVCRINCRIHPQLLLWLLPDPLPPPHWSSSFLSSLFATFDNLSTPLCAARILLCIRLIHWRVVDLLGATALGQLTLPPLEAIYVFRAPQIGVRALFVQATTSAVSSLWFSLIAGSSNPSTSFSSIVPEIWRRYGVDVSL